MNYIIMGAGTVGLQVAQFLSSEGEQVTLIEQDRDKVSRLYSRVDYKVVVDNATHKQVLVECGIDQADFFVAATDSDETNLISCSIVGQLSPKTKCIARIRNREYQRDQNILNSIFNVEYVVHPEREVAISIVRSIEYGGGINDVFALTDFNRMLIRTHTIGSHSPLIDKSLYQLEDIIPKFKDLAGKFLIVLVNRNKEPFIPSGDTLLDEDDEVFFLGLNTDLEGLFQVLEPKTTNAKAIKKIMIIGATEVTAQILDVYANSKSNNFFQLIGKNRFATRNITVIDKDIKRCETIAATHPETTVLNANVTEEYVLEELEIASADMLIATTPSQELNIVLAAHSHTLGVQKTIALVQSHTYSKIATNLGIALSVNIRESVTHSIINYLQGKKSLYNFSDGLFSVFSCHVHSESIANGNKISELDLPANSLALCINRQDKSFIVRGNIRLEENDHVLCIASQERIEKVNAFFSSKKKTNGNDKT